MVLEMKKGCRVFAELIDDYEREKLWIPSRNIFFPNNEKKIILNFLVSMKIVSSQFEISISKQILYRIIQLYITIVIKENKAKQSQFVVKKRKEISNKKINTNGKKKKIEKKIKK